jgi:hypothetical protein
MTKQKFRLEGIEGESSGEARVVDVANIYNQNSDSCGPHCTCNVECKCDEKCSHCHCVDNCSCDEKCSHCNNDDRCCCDNDHSCSQFTYSTNYF